MGTVSLSDDGVAALILTGAAVAGKLELNKVYVLGSTQDLKKYGIEAATNPLLYKDIAAFYTVAGDGAELHLLVVSEATTLTQICAPDADAPLKKLINSAAGRIRLVGINRNTPAAYVVTKEKGLDADVITAIAAAQAVAEEFLVSIAPFRVLLPAVGWTGETTSLYQPREGSSNRISVVLASDGKVGDSKQYSAAIGQVLGRAAKISVHQNLGRVRDGAIAATGYLMNGNKPEEHYSQWNLLNDAGYIFYRTFIGKNGYYLNGDATATTTTDDYCFLSFGRVIDKAVVIAYKTYIDDILDNIEVDAVKGTIPVYICKGFEASIIRAVNTSMAGEISSFTAYIDPSQNVLANGRMNVVCKIVPLATLRE
ncbi:MAG: DUF2586 family protein, partial [Ruthenibacterium sp.]